MLRSDCYKQARLTMNEHGLQDWKLGWSPRATRRLGICRYSVRTIELSTGYVAVNDWDQIRLTVLHEIAHALVGPGHGHDLIWARACVAIGGNGKRCSLVSDGLVRPPTRYRGECPGGHDIPGRSRRPTKRQACGRCTQWFAPEFEIRWYDTDDKDRLVLVGRR